jgi:hypothetical protein
MKYSLELFWIQVKRGMNLSKVFKSMVGVFNPGRKKEGWQKRSLPAHGIKRPVFALTSFRLR